MTSQKLHRRLHTLIGLDAHAQVFYAPIHADDSVAAQYAFVSPAV